MAQQSPTAEGIFKDYAFLLISDRERTQAQANQYGVFMTKLLADVIKHNPDPSHVLRVLARGGIPISLLHTTVHFDITSICDNVRAYGPQIADSPGVRNMYAANTPLYPYESHGAERDYSYQHETHRFLRTLVNDVFPHVSTVEEAHHMMLDIGMSFTFDRSVFDFIRLGVYYQLPNQTLRLLGLRSQPTKQVQMGPDPPAAVSQVFIEDMNFALGLPIAHGIFSNFQFLFTPQPLRTPQDVDSMKRFIITIMYEYLLHQSSFDGCIVFLARRGIPIAYLPVDVEREIYNLCEHKEKFGDNLTPRDKLPGLYHRSSLPMPYPHPRPPADFKYNFLDESAKKKFLEVLVFQIIPASRTVEQAHRLMLDRGIAFLFSGSYYDIIRKGVRGQLPDEILRLFKMDDVPVQRRTLAIEAPPSTGGAAASPVEPVDPYLLKVKPDQAHGIFKDFQFLFLPENRRSPEQIEQFDRFMATIAMEVIKDNPKAGSVFDYLGRRGIPTQTIHQEVKSAIIKLCLLTKTGQLPDEDSTKALYEENPTIWPYTALGPERTVNYDTAKPRNMVSLLRTILIDIIPHATTVEEVHKLMLDAGMSLKFSPDIYSFIVAALANAVPDSLLDSLGIERKTPLPESEEVLECEPPSGGPNIYRAHGIFGNFQFLFTPKSMRSQGMNVLYQRFLATLLVECMEANPEARVVLIFLARHGIPIELLADDVKQEIIKACVRISNTGVMGPNHNKLKELYAKSPLEWPYANLSPETGFGSNLDIPEVLETCLKRLILDVIFKSQDVKEAHVRMLDMGMAFTFTMYLFDFVRDGMANRLPRSVYLDLGIAPPSGAPDDDSDDGFKVTPQTSEGQKKKKTKQQGSATIFPTVAPRKLSKRQQRKQKSPNVQEVFSSEQTVPVPTPKPASQPKPSPFRFLPTEKISASGISPMEQEAKKSSKRRQKPQKVQEVPSCDPNKSASSTRPPVITPPGYIERPSPSSVTTSPIKSPDEGYDTGSASKTTTRVCNRDNDIPQYVLNDQQNIEEREPDPMALEDFLLMNWSEDAEDPLATSQDDNEDIPDMWKIWNESVPPLQQFTGERVASGIYKDFQYLLTPRNRRSTAENEQYTIFFAALLLQAFKPNVTNADIIHFLGRRGIPVSLLANDVKRDIKNAVLKNMFLRSRNEFLNELKTFNYYNPIFWPYPQPGEAIIYCYDPTDVSNYTNFIRTLVGEVFPYTSNEREAHIIMLDMGISFEFGRFVYEFIRYGVAGRLNLNFLRRVLNMSKNPDKKSRPIEYPSEKQGQPKQATQPSQQRQATQVVQPYQPRQGYQPRQRYQPRQSFTPQQPYQPRQGYQPRQRYQPRQSFTPQQPYQPRQEYQPRQRYQPRQSLTPQQPYQPRQGYQPSQRYQPPQLSYQPRQGYQPRQCYQPRQILPSRSDQRLQPPRQRYLSREPPQLSYQPRQRYQPRPILNQARQSNQPIFNQGMQPPLPHQYFPSRSPHMQNPYSPLQVLWQATPFSAIPDNQVLTRYHIQNPNPVPRSPITQIPPAGLSEEGQYDDCDDDEEQEDNDYENMINYLSTAWDDVIGDPTTVHYQAWPTIERNPQN